MGWPKDAFLMINLGSFEMTRSTYVLGFGLFHSDAGLSFLTATDSLFGDFPSAGGLGSRN